MCRERLHLDERSSAQPDFSPGTVLDEEWLLRSLLNPDHIVDGQTKPSAIPLRDLQKRGCSVDRLAHVTPEFVNKSINRWLARTSGGRERRSEGVARFTAGNVREFKDGGEQIFVVIDTALSCNRGHASVYLADSQMKESRARRMREKLLPLLANRMSVEMAFCI